MLSEFEYFQEGEYEIRLLHEFGRNVGFLDPERVRDLWIEYSKHDVLFSDYTKGKLEPFLESLSNSSSVWWELLKEGDPVGLAMLNRVIPQYDAYAHFAVWDSRAGEKISVFQKLIRICFGRYELYRMSAETPAYQTGTIRFARRLGFFQEGEKRKAVLYKGRRFGLIQLGILQEEIQDERHSIRVGEERDPDRDEGRDGDSSGSAGRLPTRSRPQPVRSGGEE